MKNFGTVALMWALASNALADYTGSSFNEVRRVVFEEGLVTQEAIESDERELYKNGNLPYFGTSYFNILADALRTTTRHEDYYPRLQKQVHPIGTCLAGVWIITEQTPYSGYFATGSKGLIISRASSALGSPVAGRGWFGAKRAFGLAGKIFPTTDENLKVKTGSFFTVDDLGGTQAEHFTDVKLTNSPPTTIGFMSPSMLVLAAKVGSAFSKADSDPSFRPLFPITQLGVKADPFERPNDPMATDPKFMRLQVAPGTFKIDEPDFRNELNVQKYYPQGLKFEIAVSNTSKDRFSEGDWQKVGEITFTESINSYGCDRQLHFAHPKINP